VSIPHGLPMMYMRRDPIFTYSARGSCVDSLHSTLVRAKMMDIQKYDRNRCVILVEYENEHFVLRSSLEPDHV
jgi:hypothetical protein